MRLTLLLVGWFILAMTVPLIVFFPSQVAGLVLVEPDGSRSSVWSQLSNGLWVLFYLEFCLFASVPIYFAKARNSRGDSALTATPRWCKLLLISWIAVTALVLIAFCIPFQVCRGWFMDTSQATSQKIQPGMSIAEAEQIIGGPPGNYVVFPRMKFSRAHNVTLYTKSWTTGQGTITVIDGVWHMGERTWIQKPDGRVHRVEWEPEDGVIAGLPGSSIGFVAILVVLLVCWWITCWWYAVGVDKVAPLPPTTTAGEELRNTKEKG